MGNLKASYKWINVKSQISINYPEEIEKLKKWISVEKAGNPNNWGGMLRDKNFTNDERKWIDQQSKGMKGVLPYSLDYRV